MARKFLAQVCALTYRKVFQLGEVIPQQAQQVEKGLIISAVGGRGKKNQMARSIGRKSFEQLVALLAALACLCAGVGFIDDDKLRA
jgi:hypothetical protein